MAKIVIAGGGLAGLACGIRLLEKGGSVELHERRHYPLKKVCGEFLSPQGWKRCVDLGIEKHLAHRPVPLKQARFFWSDSAYFDFSLKPHAWGFSREALDSALARRFEELGGVLRQGSAIESFDIDARGRSAEAGKARWIGWKGYASAADAPAALKEVQMLMLPITGGYCGLSPIEDGRISVCFVARAPAIPDALLRSHPLLEVMADKITPHASIAGFDFIASAGPNRIGDSRRVWPPLVGDGMSRALTAQSGGLGQDIQFALSKGAHSIMLSSSLRTLSGPFFRAFPQIPEFFYRLSRG